MSVLISNTNSSTIYVLNKENADRPGMTRDPRPFGDALNIYFAKRKNNLTSPDIIKDHKAMSEKFISDHNCYCCLNCYAFLVDDIEKCTSCYQHYCKNCSDLLHVGGSCPACRRD